MMNDLLMPRVRIKLASEVRALSRIPGKPPSDWNSVVSGKSLSEQLQRWSMFDVAGLTGIDLTVSSAVPDDLEVQEPLDQSIRLDMALHYIESVKP